LAELLQNAREDTIVLTKQQTQSKVKRMKSAFLVLALVWQVAAPDGPAMAPNPDYPVHVQILATKAQNGKRGAHGFGRANIVGPPAKGIDFTYDCAEPILNNGAREFYQARWKKQDLKLEILMQRIGSDHIDKCDLEVAMKDVPYALPSKH
jgi:hypothetical protein